MGCNVDTVKNINNILLHCSHYSDIRESYLPQLFTQKKGISEILDNEDELILSILDPLLSKLPEEFIQNWYSANRLTNYQESSAMVYTGRRYQDRKFKEYSKIVKTCVL